MPSDRWLATWTIALSVLFWFVAFVSLKAAYGSPASWTVLVGFVLVTGVGIGRLKLDLVSNGPLESPRFRLPVVALLFVYVGGNISHGATLSGQVTLWSILGGVILLVAAADRASYRSASQSKEADWSSVWTGAIVLAIGTIPPWIKRDPAIDAWASIHVPGTRTGLDLAMGRLVLVLAIVVFLSTLANHRRAVRRLQLWVGAAAILFVLGYVGSSASFGDPYLPDTGIYVAILGGSILVVSRLPPPSSVLATVRRSEPSAASEG